MPTSRKISFVSAESDPFSQALKQRVDAYFQDQGLSKHANAYMVFKTFFYLGSFLALYSMVLWGGFSGAATLGLCFVAGLFVSGIGFNIGHDAVHAAYSNKPWINDLMSYSFEMLGANVHNWRILHNVIHHSYTNIIEADGDLHPVPYMRFYPKEGRKDYHRFQHVYAFVLYTLTTFVWVFQKDYVHIRKKRHLIYEKHKPTPTVIANLVLCKLFYYFFFLALPLATLPFAWWQILGGFFVSHVASGLALATVFQLGHLVEGTLVQSLGPTGNLPDSWLAHQLKTSSNFANGNPLATFITGGLNYQIEHHLFPRVCHVHYADIAPIVKQTAREFGIHYQEYPTFLSALRSHARILKANGTANALPELVELAV